MPRKDGFPTNPELVAEFTETSRLTYAAAYDALIASRLDEVPYFEGKPLNAVPLIAYRRALLEQEVQQFTNTSIDKEVLQVRPLTRYDADIRREHLTLRDLPESEHIAYDQMAERIDKLTISDDLAVSTAVEQGGVIAEYTAHMHGGSSRHISTLKDKPAKQSIVSGKFFAEETYELVTSPVRLSRMTLANNALWQMGITPLMNVYFGVSYVPNLPLNGHESVQWLSNYADVMATRELRHRDTLDRLEALGAPAPIIENERRLIDKYESSARRALRLLDTK